MKCNYCNTELEPNAISCSICGAPVASDTSYKFYNPISNDDKTLDSDDLFDQFDEPYYQVQGNQNSYTYTGKVWPMKWYNFLIYFLLFFSAAYNLYYGYQFITGAQYDSIGTDYAKILYEFYPKLKIIDVIEGILTIGSAMLAIITRQKLKKFSKQGPILISFLYGFNIIETIIYLLIYSGIAKVSFSNVVDSRLIISVLTAVGMIVINKVYFSHRSHLFVN